MYVFGSGWCWRREGEWMRELVKPEHGTGECWTFTLCLVCGGGEWVGGLEHGLEKWGGVISV